MALRQLLCRSGTNQAAQRSFSAVAERHSPSVYDKMVQVTVIDGTGRRFNVRGLEGQSLIDVLKTDEGPLDVSKLLCMSPEGRGAAECVVTVPNEFTRRIPPPGEDDSRSLEQISAREITPNMRLGSKIVLSKELNNMLVSIGATYPCNTL